MATSPARLFRRPAIVIQSYIPMTTLLAWVVLVGLGGALVPELEVFDSGDIQLAHQLLADGAAYAGSEAQVLECSLRHRDGSVRFLNENIDQKPDVTRNVRAFRVMVRNTTFRWVQLLARRRYDLLAEEGVHQRGHHRVLVPHDPREHRAPFAQPLNEVLADLLLHGAGAIPGAAEGADGGRTRLIHH